MSNLRRRACANLTAMAPRFRLTLLALGLLMLMGRAADALAPRWMNRSLSPGRRAELLLRAMTLDEKILLLHGHAPLVMPSRAPEIGLMSGYVAPVPRLGIPALTETDAGLGVTSASAAEPLEGAIVLPSGVAQAATFDPDLAYQAGAMLGGEAHRKGFNVLLDGAMNLAREPRNGRTFEYAGEDPLLAGTTVGSIVRGVQDQHVVSTVKHFALNDQETGRFILNAAIDEAALRESDLLAFEIAIERGTPGSVMCAYNKVNGPYACENQMLLNAVLKRDWNYKGWVMSDWGGTHSTEAAALAGLDQEDGEELDGRSYFAAPLKDAVLHRRVPMVRLNDMVRRILRSLFATGAMDDPALPAAIDYDADAALSQRIAENAMVLLKNDGGLLPLGANVKHIAVIGGHADLGVIGGGGGSSEVFPHGGYRLRERGPQGDWPVYQSFIGTAPVAALAERLPEDEIKFYDGSDIAAASAAAARADVAVIFVTQWMTESADVPSLSLPDAQDALIGAVAAANPRTVVVLETGGPVTMPWLDKVAAVMEAWYPGLRGAEAVANVLSGAVDPSGRLPISLPVSEAQLPRPDPPAQQLVKGPDGRIQPFDVEYFEGADVGYRWYASRGLHPLFPFGAGLSYTAFRYDNLQAEGGKTLRVSFDVTNTGTRAGADVPQLYVQQIVAAGRTIRRLAGWTKVTLAPGETRHVTIGAEPRLLADFDLRRDDWHIAAGSYAAELAHDAQDAGMEAVVRLDERRMKP